jgi:hypothetical protein
MGRYVCVAEMRLGYRAKCMLQSFIVAAVDGSPGHTAANAVSASNRGQATDAGQESETEFFAPLVITSAASMFCL